MQFNFKEKNGWKTPFFVMLIVLSSFLGVASFFILDQAVTITYMQDGYKATINDLEIMTRLFSEKAKSMQRRDLIVLLRQQNPDALIDENTEGVSIGDLNFEFDQNGNFYRMNTSPE